MLYFIGGPGRVGKTTLAMRLMRDANIPFIPTDVLTHALDETYPYLEIRKEGWAAIPERWYPFLYKICRYATLTVPNYCIEGDSFLPRHISRLKEQFEVRACFLGNSRMTLDTMLQYAGHNDWVLRCSEAKREGLAGEIIATSRMFEAESHEYGFPYFDVGNDFETTLNAAFKSLLVN